VWVVIYLLYSILWSGPLMVEFKGRGLALCMGVGGWGSRIYGRRKKRLGYDG